MNLESIAATLMLLGIGVATACDADKKPATEVEGAKAPADDAARKGEMKCAEGKCAAGACGGKKHDGDEAAHADAPAEPEAKGNDRAEPEAKGNDGAEPEAKAEPEATAEPEAKAEPPEPEAKPEPAPEPPKPKPAEADPLRLEALKVVTEAFELARYLDFDAIVEKPSTYRVTVPITAANGGALRYLKDGMFGCLKSVKLEEKNAVLHIDTSKGPP